MDAQEHNSYLLNMPVLVLEKILANIHNPSNVSRTCKYLYEIVCDMEKARSVMYIGVFDATLHLNIDDDTVLDSIMKSHRTIKEIELIGYFKCLQLNERQLERMTAIIKKFGANVTSMKLYGFAVPVSLIFELLQQAPKLESLSFTFGKVLDSVMENTTMPFQLPRLKSLEIYCFPGLLDIINLIPAGSLNFYSGSIDQSILTKQRNIKSLTIYSDVTGLCIDHLQLDTLIISSFTGFTALTGKILKCQTDLKELRFINDYMSESSFQWICNNLKKLEVFEVDRLRNGNAFKVLGKLTRLRHFCKSVASDLFDNGIQSFPFKSDSIEKFEIGSERQFCFGELLNSMAHKLPNLTHLKMKFKNFSAFTFVLRHCPKIIHLNSCISDPIPHHLTDQSFPSIQTLELYNFSLPFGTHNGTTSQCMTSIVHAMPNLKSMSLSTGDGIRFDVNTMRDFIKGSKSLEYFYVDHFLLNRELSTNDVVETIRCLMGQLKGYHINFRACTLSKDLNFDKIKDALSNEFYVRGNSWNLPSFDLYKGGVKKFHSKF